MFHETHVQIFIVIIFGLTTNYNIVTNILIQNQFTLKVVQFSKSTIF